jgi:hypothetical protein
MLTTMTPIDTTKPMLTTAVPIANNNTATIPIANNNNNTATVPISNNNTATIPIANNNTATVPISNNNTTLTPTSTPTTTTTPGPTIDLNSTITNQNNSLSENLKYMKNKNSADQQKIFYLRLQTQYMVIVNFYLFYLYTFLAIIFGYYWFFVKPGYTIYMKWFWYLHIIALPYFLVYLEFVFYYMLKFIFSWITGNPFLPWHNYTSFPPVY